MQRDSTNDRKRKHIAHRFALSSLYNCNRPIRLQLHRGDSTKRSSSLIYLSYLYCLCWTYTKKNRTIPSLKQPFTRNRTNTIHWWCSPMRHTARTQEEESLNHTFGVRLMEYGMGTTIRSALDAIRCLFVGFMLFSRCGNQEWKLFSYSHITKKGRRKCNAEKRLNWKMHHTDDTILGIIEVELYVLCVCFCIQ